MKALHIWIREDELVAARACPKGMALYRAVHAEQSDLRRRRGKAPLAGKIRIPWTPLSYVWLSLSGFSRWLFHARLAPMPYLSGADLGSANLYCADLYGANLRGANLSSAYLRGANLGGADLGSANLGSANLGSANLRGANLSGANLGSANLGSANLRDADLSGADLGDWERGPDGYARRKVAA